MSARADQRRVGARKRSNHGSAALTLRDLRESLELSIRAVESRTGIRRAAISEIERHLRLPRPSELRALADCYGIDPDAFEIVVEYRLPAEAP